MAFRGLPDQRLQVDGSSGSARRISDCTAFGERAEVMFDDVLHDRVVGVEVAMRQVVPHAGDLLPRHSRCAVQELRVDALDRFADLDEADANSVVDHAVVQVASR